MVAEMAHAAMPTRHFPLHLVLTDYIRSKRYRSELIQVLYRQGICSSRDTFQRHKTSVIIQCYSDDLQREAATGAFSVMSIDNIDHTAPGKQILFESPLQGFQGNKARNM